MKNNILYLFKTERINIANLFQFCITISSEWPEKCQVGITNSNYLYVIESALAKRFSPDNPANFRNIDWTNKIKELELFLNSTKFSIGMGVHSIEQLALLKNYFSYRVKTISTSYDESLYYLILNNLVNSHIHEQKLGYIPIDYNLPNNTNPIEYYRKSFDQLKLIPRKLEPVGEYDIPIKDFFNRYSFFEHIRNIGVIPNKQAETFYDKWRIQHESR